MPTIKTKKEMNLPELIEWGWKNEIKKRSFTSNDDKVTANFEDMGRFIADNFISSDVTFTVEVEEEITEHTVLPKLVTRNTSGRYNGWISECVKGFHLELIEAIYILNDDLTMTLIWTKEKGLIS
ncbi:hypothetical protein JRU67_11900 [Mammaliicoccus sciuri]|uniref:Uncharacterized protein n=1 Tax=Mammaliicoccus sciuri TaxID=1296 RepID=A0AB37HLJ0_MAMSC|nr:hypothetical protein [Mammaliicoccus sciuri]QRN90744.1 hypothetical protein JRU67_11900 [Mammaliicoccus sciuri]